MRIALEIRSERGSHQPHVRDTWSCLCRIRSAPAVDTRPRLPLTPFNKLADMLFRHLEGLLNYCWIRVLFGVVEAVNGNVKALLRRGRGYKDLRYLLLKVQRMAALKTEFLVLEKAA